MKIETEGLKNVGIEDTDYTQIDLATEDTQTQILTALNTLVAGSGQITTINQGRKVISVTGTAVQLDNVVCKRVIITALSTNAEMIVMGGSGVIFTEATRTGTQLLPLNSMDIPVDNLNKIYINGNANDGVSYTYYT